MSLTFIQPVVFQEFCHSLLNVPVILLSPVLVFIVPSGGVERYVRRRFQHPHIDHDAPASGGPIGSTTEHVVDLRHEAPQEQQIEQIRYPACFFALPLPTLLKISSRSTDDAFWKIEVHAFVTLAMM